MYNILKKMKPHGPYYLCIVWFLKHVQLFLFKQGLTTGTKLGETDIESVRKGRLTKYALGKNRPIYGVRIHIIIFMSVSKFQGQNSVVCP